MTLIKIKYLYDSELTIIPGPCAEHAGCTEYSVIPADPTQGRYVLHSAQPDVYTDALGLRMIELDAILRGRANQ